MTEAIAAVHRKRIFENFSIDLSRRRVFCGHREVDLTACEYKILEYLTGHPGQVVSKEELIDFLYSDKPGRPSNLVEVFICRLRRKLDPSGEHNPVVTVRGRGYRIG
ncbi:winged helix-turn-helix domain-containing protein [Exilibacterium tricleocarpae]|nr:winged helix-turn-helix domain-containing protein [Exilibacterium tricleocarpae]